MTLVVLFAQPLICPPRYGKHLAECISEPGGEQAKAYRAEELIAHGDTSSIQVLHEIANAAPRKLRMSWTETRNFLTTIRELLQVEPTTIATDDAGIDLADAGLDLSPTSLWSELVE